MEVLSRPTWGTFSASSPPGRRGWVVDAALWYRLRYRGGAPAGRPRHECVGRGLAVEEGGICQTPVADRDGQFRGGALCAAPSGIRGGVPAGSCTRLV